MIYSAVLGLFIEVHYACSHIAACVASFTECVVAFMHSKSCKEYNISSTVAFNTIYLNVICYLKMYSM